jgi:hypothetical protein
MFHMGQLATPHCCHIIARLDAAIRLLEDHVAWGEAFSARLARAGRATDASYARASLELGRLYLDSLRQARRQLRRERESRQARVPYLEHPSSLGWRWTA